MQVKSWWQQLGIIMDDMRYRWRARREKRKPRHNNIERLMDAATTDVAAGWQSYMGIDRYRDDTLNR